MKTNRKLDIGRISLLLIVPALVFCSAGVLYLAFGLRQANELLDVLMSNPLGKAFFSPIIVLGGPALVVLLNLSKVCRLRIGSEGEELQIALTVRRVVGNLFPAMLAGFLILLMLSYAFVENFRIVVR